MSDRYIPMTEPVSVDEAMASLREKVRKGNKHIAKLESQIAAKEAEVEVLNTHIDYFTGFFAPLGIAEPGEGYAKAPSHLKYSVMKLRDEYEALAGEVESE